MNKEQAMEQYKKLHNKPNKLYTPKSFQQLVIDNYTKIEELYKKDESLTVLYEVAHSLLCSILSREELKDFYANRRNLNL